MTSIERTAYPRFRRAPTIRELRDLYTPTPADIAFVATTARGPTQKFGLMILLKTYQRLGYFPKPETIPGAIIGHIRAVMKLGADLVPDAVLLTRWTVAITIKWIKVMGRKERYVRFHQRKNTYATSAMFGLLCVLKPLQTLRTLLCRLLAIRAPRSGTERCVRYVRKNSFSP